MTAWPGRTWRWSCVLALLASHAFAQGASSRPPLAGTSWQLVQFRGGDDTVVTPDDGSKYTLAFRADGRIAVRVDCNRGGGAWKSSEPGQLELGPMALTRAMCPPQSMHDRIVKHWPHIRSYLVKDGHLFLSLMADGGIYEFQPLAPATPPLKPAVTVSGPATWTCTGGEARSEVTLNSMGTASIGSRSAAP
jgi:hypothetical protein